jgi:hypothetical protein
MKILYKLYLLTFLVFLLPLTGHAVQLTGNPGNYQSLINQLTPGSELYLEPGTYTGGLPVIDMHGEPGSPIVITGPSEGEPAIFTGNSCCNTVQIKDSSYVVISNLRIDGLNISGIDAVNGRGVTHNITISGLTIVGHAPDQGTIGISTKGPAWDWLIKDNYILEAGTGMYLGNSDGGLPFVRGVIEHNVIVDTIGYNVEIKHQNPRPTDIGMPPGISKTIIRDNVFSKQNNASTGNMARPNVLVGHAPDTGEGKDDYYEIYGNFFYQNPSEALFQGEGNVAFYSNLLINDFGQAVNITSHNGVPKKVDVFLNTVVASTSGIRITNASADYEQQAVGNAVFAATGITAPVNSNNIYDTYQAASDYLNAPFAAIGTLDLYPVTGKLTGAKINIDLFGAYTDSNLDFNGDSRQGDFRGAYAGEGQNPGWLLALERKAGDATVPTDPTPAPSISMDVTPQSVATGGFVTVSWNAVGADACTASGHSDWSGTKAPANVIGEAVGPIDTAVTLSLTCVNGGGGATASVEVAVVQAGEQPPTTGGGDGVIGISDTTPSNYIWDSIDDGKLLYVDRDYVFMSVTDEFRGLDYLQTANEDKFSSGDGFISFTVSEPVEVLVGFDSRSSTLPSWLEGWTDLGENVFSTAVPLSLYQKEFPAGTVQLGGNEMGFSMYTVIVKGLDVADTTQTDKNTDITVSAAATSMYDLIMLCVLAILFVLIRNRSTMLKHTQS